MVRGRVGDAGQIFNLGEITMTRCTIKIDEVLGFGYVAGRSHHHSELAALWDGLMQLPEWHQIVKSIVIEFLEAEAKRKKSLGYSTQRSYGRTHPFAGEIKMSEVEVMIFPEELGFEIANAEITITEVENLNMFTGSKEAPPQLTRGYGLTFRL